MSVVRDYSGVATDRLAAIYNRYVDVDHTTFAARIGMNERQLKSIVHHIEYPWTGLGNADKIILGLGLAPDVLGSDELPIVPGGLQNVEIAAQYMIEDRLYAEISSEWDAPFFDLETEEGQNAHKLMETLIKREINERLTAREADLAIERMKLVASKPVPNEEQRERLDRDAARTKARNKKRQAAA